MARRKLPHNKVKVPVTVFIERGEVLRLGNSRELKVARARLQAEVLEHLTGSNGLMEMLHPKKNKK